MSRKIKVLIYLAAIVVLGALVFGVPFSDDSPQTDKEIIERPVPTGELNLTENNGYTELYNSVRGGVVTVYSGGLSDSNSGRSQGSGFIFDSNGNIVTNQHVVDGESVFYIKYADGSWSRAELVGTDRRTDLAVLKPQEMPEIAHPLPVSNEIPERGEPVIAVGSPANLENSLTRGIISGVNRTMESQTGHTIPDTIQSDATLSIGNSGGPLINGEGVVVGVNRAKQGDTVSLAVSPRIVNKVVPSIIENGSYSHPFLGVRLRNVNPAISGRNDYIENNEGVMVVGTVAGSPADGVLKGGTDATVPTGGDVILEMDGEKVRSAEHVSSIIMIKNNPGDKIDFKINRKGDIKNVTVELGSQS